MFDIDDLTDMLDPTDLGPQDEPRLLLIAVDGVIFRTSVAAFSSTWSAHLAS